MKPLPLHHGCAADGIGLSRPSPDPKGACGLVRTLRRPAIRLPDALPHGESLADHRRASTEVCRQHHTRRCRSPSPQYAHRPVGGSRMNDEGAHAAGSTRSGSENLLRPLIGQHRTPPWLLALSPCSSGWWPMWIYPKDAPVVPADAVQGVAVDGQLHADRDQRERGPRSRGGRPHPAGRAARRERNWRTAGRSTIRIALESALPGTRPRLHHRQGRTQGDFVFSAPEVEGPPIHEPGRRAL